jgi:NADPH:quinone reductase-like Zn-dependent oxidoreductase
MKAYVIPKGSASIDELRLVNRAEPLPGPGQIVVRVRAASLNYRDQAIASGRYALGAVTRDTVPLSDGAGEVIALGSGVTQFKVGDRVAGTFFQHPPDGTPMSPPAALGSPLDGMLSEHIALFEDGAVAIPAGYSFEEAACLPCAGVTAWHALFRAGRPLRPGDTVLALGTGGVSMFALQFARIAGARVIVTSSSDEKLERVSGMGAAATINYVRTPDWDKEVLRLTGGRGVDCIVEVGGAGTLGRSFQSVGRNGKIGLIGVLTGREGDTTPYGLMFKGATLHGIFVGDRPMFEEMNRGIDANGLRPVIDKVFAFADAPAAYRHHAAGAFMGKIVIAF